MGSKIIAVTGCYGHVGTYVVEKLTQDGHTVIGLDIREFAKHKLHRSATFIPMRIDLADPESIKETFDEIAQTMKVDILVHIAFIIPPMTTKNLKLSEKVNIDGSKSIFKVMREHNPEGHILFTSSIATLKPRPLEADLVPYPPETTDIASTTYGKHKVVVENHLKVKYKDYPWTICKLASVLIPEKYIKVDKDENQYAKKHLPWDTKAQGVHVRNVAEAYASIAAEPSKFDKKSYVLGGKPEDRMLFDEYIASIMHTLTGLPKHITKEVMPKYYPMKDRYYMHWYDVEQANKDLNYLKFSFDDFIQDLQSEAGFGIRIFKGFNSTLCRISQRYAYWFANRVLK